MVTGWLDYKRHSVYMHISRGDVTSRGNRSTCMASNHVDLTISFKLRFIERTVEVKFGWGWGLGGGGGGGGQGNGGLPADATLVDLTENEATYLSYY